MKMAIIYARVSTQRQADDGVSMESQIDQCRIKAKALGAEVVQVFRDDGVSGRSDKRPGFQAALAYCAAQRVNYFVCWSTSRFGRNLEQVLKNAHQLLDWGTRAAYVHQDIDLDTESGFILSVMTGMMDEIYSRNIARDTLRSMISASKDGYFVGGRVPYGYQVEKVGKRSKLVPHDADAMVVRKMFALVLQNQLGAQAIAAKLNDEGLLRTEGKRWGKNTVTAILHNPSYAGRRMFNRTKKKTREAKDADQVVQVDSHPALVSSDDFEKVQIMMKERIPHHESGGTPRSAFVFTGLVKCGMCDDNLQMSNGKGRAGKLYHYYACLGHKHGRPKCLAKPIPAPLFDMWMLNELLDKVLTVQAVQTVISEVIEKGGDWAKERETKRRGLVKDLRALEKRRDHLFDVFETEGVNSPTIGQYKTRLAKIGQEISDIERDLRELELRQLPDERITEIDADIAVETIHDTILKCHNPVLLRGFVGTFVSSITMTRTSAIVEYREDALLLGAQPASVHGGISWLPAERSLRTKIITIPRPMDLMEKRRYA